MDEKQDIFDKIMSLPVICIFEPFYKKNKEVLLYLFFGFLTFLISIGIYAYFCVTLEMNELIANVISWIVAVFFAFVTNRIWVFQTKTNAVMEYVKQMCAFYMGRVVTLVIEEMILAIFIGCLGWDKMLVKIVAQIIVIILNYVISKWIVFKKK